ncbi:MAG: Imm17 family immunity protein [Bacteroidota bacterium]|nr:Imm17 family immunity protein [Bacteroidota bacterium]
MEYLESWIDNNKPLFGKIISLLLLGLGICLVVGAFKNWDWLYAADKHYQNNWTMGQISRYLGRTTARIIGFFGGVFIIFIALYLICGAFFK